MDCHPSFVKTPRRGLRKAGGDRGFSLVEVAMAAFVLTFALTSSIMVLRSGFRAIDTARGITLASQILQSEMESLRLKSWSDIKGLAASQTYKTTVFTAAPSLAEKYDITRTIKDVGTDMREITLAVTWKSSDGLSHTRTFRTVYGKNGLYDYYYTVARAS